MTLDTQQTQFVDELLHGDTHMILTGRAGTGKSTALCHGVKAAATAGMDVLVMAPTAMAASIHRDAGLESGTIHHALKWNPAKEPLPWKLLSVACNPIQWGAKPDQNRILVVDEASMVGLWLFEVLARDLGKPERPFDGRRLVLVGDWAQLPPVVGPEEEAQAKKMPDLQKFGPPDGCVLYHPLFTARPPVAVVLEETHRANGEWFDKLNALRDVAQESGLGRFRMSFPRAKEAGRDDDSVHLCFRRASAHMRNCEVMARLPGKPVRLQLRDGEAELKTGCKVIVTSNRAGGDYINGSRATFAGVDARGRVLLDDGEPLKMLADGNWGHSRGGGYEGDTEGGRRMAQRFLRDAGVLESEAVKFLEDVLRNDSTAARLGDGRTKFLPYWPILPGYAITVHKAQGASLASVVLDADVFWGIAPARLPYVALSRVSDESQIALDFRNDLAKVRPDPAYPAMFSRILKWRKV